MKKLIIPLLLILVFFCGCAEITQQVDVEAIITGVIESIDWEELESYAQQGYDALVEKFPALKAENVKAFLKDNGLELMNKLLSSTDEATQENANKLGAIIKILYPDLADEVDAVLAED